MSITKREVCKRRWWCQEKALALLSEMKIIGGKSKVRSLAEAPTPTSSHTYYFCANLTKISDANNLKEEKLGTGGVGGDGDREDVFCS